MKRRGFIKSMTTALAVVAVVPLAFTTNVYDIKNKKSHLDKMACQDKTDYLKQYPMTPEEAYCRTEITYKGKKWIYYKGMDHGNYKGINNGRW